MAKDDLASIEGKVSDLTRGGVYLVKLDNGVDITAHASGKMRQRRIRVLTGDRVTVEMSPYDLTKGRINFRHKDTTAPVFNPQQRPSWRR